MGSGIWSMHFIGMLALHLPIPLSYDIPMTLLSMFFAVVASGFARGAKGAPWSSAKSRLEIRTK